MAITATALTTSFSTTSGTGPYTTGSVTPTANQPVLLALHIQPSAGVTVPAMTVSGCGLTWTKVTQTAGGSGIRTLFLFLGIGASPTSGAITITGDGVASFNSCWWQVTQLAGVATAVNNGVVQSVNAKPASATSVSVAFPSTITGGNATFAGVAIAANAAASAGTGWTSEGAVNGTGNGLLGEFAATAQQNIRANWTGSANAFVVGVELAAAYTGGTDITESGPVAKVTATAPAGTVTVTGGTLTLNGPAAVVQASAPVGSVSIVNAVVAGPVTLSWPVPDWFKTAVRSSYGLTYTVDAYYQGNAVAGATGMEPVGGTITDTIKPGVRRTLQVDFAGDKTLYDALAPTGTTLRVTAHVTLTSQQVVDVPMGVFVIDQATLSEGGGKLSVTAPDRWVLIQRAKFMGPASSTPGTPITDTIRLLILGALGNSETVAITSQSQVTVGALTWQKDREKAIQDLATSAGLWVYTDRNGTFTIADQPTISEAAVWLADASNAGVLVSLDRQKSRTRTYNVVVVDSSSSTSSPFPTQYVFDSDPNSPTYAGPDPVNHPELAGPFGIAPYPWSDPNLQTEADAQRAGLAILSRTVGIASQVNLTQVPNPALDSFDAVDVLPPGRVQGSYNGIHWTLGPDVELERHIADTVTHPLVQPDNGSGGNPLQIQGRSTRTDPYT